MKLHYLRLATFGEAICHHSATILTPETSTKAHQVLLLRNLDEIYAWELISHPSIVTLHAIFQQQDDVVNNIPLVSNASKRKYALSTFKDRWLYVLRRNSTRYKSQDLGAWALAAGRDSKCFETWLIEGITNLPRAADRDVTIVRIYTEEQKITSFAVHNKKRERASNSILQDSGWILLPILDLNNDPNADEEERISFGS